jgi:uncharacterized protein
MTAPTLVYLHGFRSSPASVKATRLAALVAALPLAVRPALIVPALDHRPARAMAAIDAIAAAHDPRRLAFVGSSLGGFYATVAAERYAARAALINPAIRPDVDLRPHAGVQLDLHTGAAFDVTDAHFDELAAMRVRRVTRPERYFLLVQTGDEVLDYRQAVAFYAGAFQYVEGGGDHAFAGFDAQVPAILRFCGVDGIVQRT